MRFVFLISLTLSFIHNVRSEAQVINQDSAPIAACLRWLNVELFSDQAEQIKIETVQKLKGSLAFYVVPTTMLRSVEISVINPNGCQATFGKNFSDPNAILQFSDLPVKKLDCELRAENGDKIKSAMDYLNNKYFSERNPTYKKFLEKLKLCKSVEMGKANSSLCRHATSIRESCALLPPTANYRLLRELLSLSGLVAPNVGLRLQTKFEDGMTKGQK